MIPLSALQLDLLTECVNIGMGRAADALGRMCGTHVVLSVPEIRVLDPRGLAEAVRTFCQPDCHSVFLPFFGGFMGLAALIYSGQDGDRLVTALTAEAAGLSEMTEALRSDVLRETGNVVLVGVLGAMGTVLGVPVHYRPLFSGRNLAGPLTDVVPDGPVTLYLRARFSLERVLVAGDILVVFTQAGFTALRQALDGRLA